MAFTYSTDGMTAGVGGSKKIFGKWSTATSTSGTITFGTTYTPIAAGAVYSTTVTTATCPNTVKVTNGTLVLGVVDDGAAGYWWVEVL